MFLPLLPIPLLPAQAQAAPEPVWEGDPEAAVLLGSWIEGALASTAAFGDWPQGPWTILLHTEDAAFERATGAPTGRAATWAGPVLHLRPWGRLRRRDLGVLLRHELTHRRVESRHLPRWKEEALCLWAEGHTHPLAPWPPDPEPPLQRRLDLALESGGTARQRWAYAWLRAWLAGGILPDPPRQATPSQDPWRAETVSVVWPPERLPRAMTVNGQPLP